MNSLKVTDRVRQQYERFPYPPVPSIALPGRGQGLPLRYERGAELRGTPNAINHTSYHAPGDVSHEGKRILVAGCGTIEALVVAQMHPRAKEIVTVDASESSLARLRRRIGWARGRNIALPHRRMKLPPIRLVRADLFEFDSGRFDYIIATDVLHHTSDPAGLLGRLARMLVPGGMLRLATYPKASRIWMRAASSWLRLNGISSATRGLRKEVASAIAGLPAGHPIRTCVETHPETRTDEGTVDAFLHSLENSLRPAEWAQAAADAGLVLFAEDQPETSRGEFLIELMPETETLGAWERLQIMDDLLELCANPVLWFSKEEEGSSRLRPANVDTPQREAKSETTSQCPFDAFVLSHEKSVRSLAESLNENERARIVPLLALPSALRAELGANLRRADRILAEHELRLDVLLDVLRREIGPRVAPPPSDRELPGLTLGEYPTAEIMNLPAPWSRGDWELLESRLQRPHRLRVDAGFEPDAAPNSPRFRTLADQAEYLQLRFGFERSWLGPLRLDPLPRS